MTIELIEHIRCKRILDDILELLKVSNQEFVPPLSSRKSTTQKQLDCKNEAYKVPYEYFDNIQAQSVFIAVENSEVIGFMSFKENYSSDEIPIETIPNVYITTIIVNPNYRHRGICNNLYTSLLKQFGDRNVFTRTWSTNNNHLRILKSRGFYEYRVLKNDRGIGIDTVYYHHKPIVGGE